LPRSLVVSVVYLHQVCDCLRVARVCNFQVFGGVGRVRDLQHVERESVSVRIRQKYCVIIANFVATLITVSNIGRSLGILAILSISALQA